MCCAWPSRNVLVLVLFSDILCMEDAEKQRNQFSVCCLGHMGIIPCGNLLQVESKSSFVLMNIIVLVIIFVTVMSSYPDTSCLH